MAARLRGTSSGGIFTMRVGGGGSSYADGLLPRRRRGELLNRCLRRRVGRASVVRGLLLLVLSLFSKEDIDNAFVNDAV